MSIEAQGVGVPCHTGAATASGRLTLIVGCMFAGKTTELLRRLVDQAAEGRVAVKHAIDVRYQREAIVTHSGKRLEADVVDSAAAILGILGLRTKLVGIDEAHFFGPEIREVLTVCRSRGIDVVLTALDRDCWGRPFETIDRLRESADEVIILRARCAQCGSTADRTQRLTPIVGGNLVGGAESFEPRCQGCWHAPPETPDSKRTTVPIFGRQAKSK